MFAQWYLPSGHGLSQAQLNFQKCVLAGNWLMLTSGLIMASSIMITFGLEQHFSLASQVAGHITTIISAAFLKIAYVIRCVGVHGLGYKVF